MAAVKARQTSVREMTAVKEQTFQKSYRNDNVIEVENWKENQAVHPSQDRHGTLEPGPLKTRPPGLTKEERHLILRKASKIDCSDPEGKYRNDSYSAHDMRADEARRRGSQFKDLLIRPVHMMELDEKRRYSRSSLWGQNLDIGMRDPNSLENSHTGRFSQSRTKSFLDRRKSSVSFAAGRKKSSLINAIAFSRTSIMTEKKGKSLVQINHEQTIQARRESKMDSMGTCTYVKVRHILSDKQGLMTDVYNQLQKGWLAIGNKVPPKDFGKLAEKYSVCPSSKEGGDLGWVPRAKPGAAGPFQEVAFTTPVGAVSNVFQSSQGFHILMIEGRKN
ncbi:hypothetical protein KC19_10G157400 [Ceratodon purpureus]|uniref:peptidylprolyl isomerase n=1 Tax=Ceratodon purpureus TaxID=3225 RepID=A0A8T0GKU4_CERPU|nr:hypothetical protein KC19_10G157400 [Ceratodon purpureus]